MLSLELSRPAIESASGEHVKSRSHDCSPEGPARWANLSTAERLSDCIHDIQGAVETIASTLASEPPPATLAGTDMHAAITVFRAISCELAARLPPYEPVLHSRDADLAEAMQRIDEALLHLYALPPEERDRAHFEVERIAAPYALAFFYEIRLLERGQRT